MTLFEDLKRQGVDALELLPQNQPKAAARLNATEDLTPSQKESKTNMLPASDIKSLAELRSEIGDCQRCRLGATRNQLVFGVGNENADLVFVGEAPGKDEDLSGEPFVGRAGKLLTSIIEAIGLRREDIYICNVIKCRPPQNRNPETDEIHSCEPFLKKQIEIIAPKVICSLGKFAAQCLLKTETPISQLRGVFTSYEGVDFMPTYHPAYLLRNPSAKKDVWEDMKKVHARLEKLTGKKYELKA